MGSHTWGVNVGDFDEDGACAVQWDCREPEPGAEIGCRLIDCAHANTKALDAGPLLLDRADLLLHPDVEIAGWRSVKHLRLYLHKEIAKGALHSELVRSLLVDAGDVDAVGIKVSLDRARIGEQWTMRYRNLTPPLYVGGVRDIEVPVGESEEHFFIQYNDGDEMHLTEEQLENLQQLKHCKMIERGVEAAAVALGDLPDTLTLAFWVSLVVDGQGLASIKKRKAAELKAFLEKIGEQVPRLKQDKAQSVFDYVQLHKNDAPVEVEEEAEAEEGEAEEEVDGGEAKQEEPAPALPAALQFREVPADEHLTGDLIVIRANPDTTLEKNWLQLVWNGVVSVEKIEKIYFDFNTGMLVDWSNGTSNGDSELAFEDRDSARKMLMALTGWAKDPTTDPNGTCEYFFAR